MPSPLVARSPEEIASAYPTPWEDLRDIYRGVMKNYSDISRLRDTTARKLGLPTKAEFIKGEVFGLALNAMMPGVGLPLLVGRKGRLSGTRKARRALLAKGKRIPHKHKIFGKPPSKGLVPALRIEDKTYRGKLGEAHSTIVERLRLGDYLDEKIGSGFVGPEGKYLTRQEALNYLGGGESESFAYKRKRLLDLDPSREYHDIAGRYKVLTPESLANKHNVEYLGEAEGLYYFNRGPHTIATKGLEEKALVEKIKRVDVYPAQPTLGNVRKEVLK